MKVAIIIGLLGVVLMGSGCASIVSKSDWPVKIDSNPTGAKVAIKDQMGLEVRSGTTPMTTVLPSKAGFLKAATYQITFEKEGYTQTTAPFSARMNEWYIGNIIFGGLIGCCIVDPATGAMWKLDDTIYGNLSVDPNFIKKESKEEPRKTIDIPTKLKELKEKGILNDDEYEKRRKVLIDQL